MILQGEATYRNEPLVMLRVGAASRASSYEWVGPGGERIEARSGANNYEPPIPTPGAYLGM